MNVIALFNHPTIGVALLDRRGRYEMVSPSAARFLGDSPDNLLGKQHRDYFPSTPRYRELSHCRQNNWICYSQPSSREANLRHGYWDISLMPRMGSDSRPCGFIMLIQEAASFRRAVREVTWQRRLFRTLLEEVPTGIVLAQGHDGHITMMNALARKLLGGGIRTGVRIQDSGTETLATIHPSHLAPMLNAIRTGKGQEEIALRYTNKDGRAITLLMDCAPVGSWDGEPAAIAVLQDITGYAEYERQLEQQNEYLQELDHAKDTFLANISHELKTPLTAILGWVQAARELDNPDFAQQALEVIERNAQRQAWMIDDLLTLTNCLAGRVILHCEKSRLLPICEEAVVRARLATKDPLVTIDLRGVDDMACYTDPLRLRQLLENVLTNALKFTPRGGAITLTAAERDGWVTIVVTDTGIGLDAESVRSVFHPFWQADSTPSRKYNGTGIGLAVVKELVTLHGGDVWVESEGLDKGARVRICLPGCEKTARPHAPVNR